MLTGISWVTKELVFLLNSFFQDIHNVILFPDIRVSWVWYLMKIQANDMLYNSLLFSKLEIEHSKMASLHKRITTSMVTSWCFLDNNAAPSCAPSLMKQMRNSTACYTSSLPLGTYICSSSFLFLPFPLLHHLHKL